MEPPPGPTPEAEVLLRYAQATYTAVTEQRRRVATALLVVAAGFAALAVVCGVQWATTSAAVDDVEDAALVDTLGVRVPDPRPALERAELRLRAFGWAVLAGGALLVAVVSGGLYLLIRPSALPPELQRLSGPGTRPQPPM